jgi:ribosomal protein S18 acetylase RimI-like enzyme
LRVEVVGAADAYDLRRRVLRGGRPDAEVAFPEDGRPGAFHLAVRSAGEGDLVAVASFSPEPAPSRAGRRAVHLRGLAVDQAWQCRGVGRCLFEAAVARLRQEGVEVLWANARDSALGFYQRLGMEVVGEGFLLPETGIPHHVVVLDLG